MKRLLILLGVMGLGSSIVGQVSITTTPQTYTQNFDGLSNSGTNIWINDATISGWYSTEAVYEANTGTSTSGDLYSYGAPASTERALGSLASGTSGTIRYGVRFQNNTGSTITSLTISYTGEQWRSTTAAANVLTFSYQQGATVSSLTTGTYLSESLLDFTAPTTSGTGAIDGNDMSNQQSFTNITIFVNIPAGEEIMLRWSDPNESGSDQGLAIDDFSVTFDVSAAPTPSSAGDIIFTEIMYNPSGAESNQEWLEVYNTTGADLDLNGCELTDGEDTEIIASALVVPAGGYLVLAEGNLSICDGSATGNYAYTAANLTLANGGDQIQLTCGGTTIDILDYSTAGFTGVSDGESLSLDDETNQDDSTNDNGTNWCSSVSTCGSNDFGTPGIVNDNCCRITDIGELFYCLDGGTNDNPFDDLYSISLNPTAEGNASTYDVSGDITDNNLSYGGAEDFLTGSYFPGSSLNITLTDDGDPGCTFTTTLNVPSETCSFNSAGVVIESQFVNPCGDEGPNEFLLITTTSPVDINNLAIGSARNINDFTHFWSGTNVTNPGDIPGSSSTELCGGLGVQCYNWVDPSAGATIYTDVVTELNFVAGCNVFSPIPASGNIPPNVSVAAFLGAGFECSFGDQDGNSNTGTNSNDAFNLTSTNINFSSFCSGGTPIKTLYVLLGDANQCSNFGYFANDDPRNSFLYDGTGINSQSFDFNNVEPSIITPTGQVEGGPCIPPPPTLLPVNFSTFTARPDRNRVLLNWTTATELNNAYFLIQKSFNGYEFSDIGRMQGAGTNAEPQSYTFIDFSPQPGLNYYRLKQVDFDGRFEYSNTLAISFETDEVVATLVPTQTSNELQLQISTANQQDQIIEIFNIMGRQVKATILPAQFSQLTMNVANLQPGHYFVRFVAGGKV